MTPLSSRGAIPISRGIHVPVLVVSDQCHYNYHNGLIFLQFGYNRALLVYGWTHSRESTSAIFAHFLLHDDDEM